MQLPLDEYAEVTKVRKTMQSTILDMRDELDQHLDSINQNTMEIQGNYDYLEELDKRMDKIESKLDQLSQLLSQHHIQQEPIESISLTSEEKELFFTLYTSQEPLSFEELAHRTKVESFMIEDFLSSMQIKKVPLEIKHFAGKTFVLLSENFKNRQAKERLIAV